MSDREYRRGGDDDCHDNDDNDHDDERVRRPAMTTACLNAVVADPRAADLLAAHDRAIVRRCDRMFAGLFVLEWIAAVVAAVMLAPYTWVGAVRSVHPHVWAA